MTACSAPIWKRLLAYIYDVLIVTALILIAGLIASVLAQGEAPAWLTQILIIVLVSGYFWWSWCKVGKTAGMRAWRLRVVDIHGEPLTRSVAFKRLILCILTLAPTALLLLTGRFSPTNQTLYDRLSRTRVIAEPKASKSTKKSHSQ